MTCHSISPHEPKLGRLHHCEVPHHSARALRLAPNSMARRRVYRKIAPPRMVVHCGFGADTAARYGYPRERLAFIPLGFAEPPAAATGVPGRPLQQPLRLLTIAGLVHSKGLHDLLTALPSLLRRFGAVEWQIIGEVRDPTCLAHLQRLALRLGVQHSVQFVIDATEDQRREALRTADVYVQPSHEEGFCLTYLEAIGSVPMLVGTDPGASAAVSADDPGARFVVPRMPGELAAAICEPATCNLRTTHTARREKRLLEVFGWPTDLASRQRLYAAACATRLDDVERQKQ